MWLYKVIMGINEIESMLKLSTVLRKSRRLAGQTTQFLTKRQIVSLNIGGVDLAFGSIGSLKPCRLELDGMTFAKDHILGYLDHSSSLALLMDLGIPQVRQGNASRLAWTPRQAGRARIFPLTKEFQENHRIMLQRVRGK